MKSNPMSPVVGLSVGFLLLTSLSTPIVVVPAIASQPQIAQNAATSRKRIVIMDFDYGSTGVNSNYWNAYRGVGAAKGISEILINELVNDGTYTVVDRSRLEQALKARNVTGPIDVSTAVEVGKELGVDAVIVGTVTRFNLERQSGGGGLFGVGARSEKTTASVQIDARIISTATGDILATARGTGEADESNSNISVMGIGGGTSGTNEDNLLSAAVDRSIAQLVTKLAESADRL